MTLQLHGFTSSQRVRLTALHERVRRIYPEPAHRYLDYQSACWKAFWEFLNEPEMVAVRKRSEWAGELVDVTISVKEKGGIHITSVTLKDCMTVAGLTREQALQNLDMAVDRYIRRLEQMPSSPLGNHQLATMRRYLMQRKQGGEEECPCAISPCQCEHDISIAH